MQGLTKECQDQSKQAKVDRLLLENEFPQSKTERPIRSICSYFKRIKWPSTLLLSSRYQLVWICTIAIHNLIRGKHCSLSFCLLRGNQHATSIIPSHTGRSAIVSMTVTVLDPIFSFIRLLQVRRIPQGARLLAAKFYSPNRFQLVWRRGWRSEPCKNLPRWCTFRFRSRRL
jgi:hypothetical protein